MLDLEVPWLDEVVRAKRPQRLPVVLSREEVRAVLQPLVGAPRLMAYLLYGAGLRLLECCRLRVDPVGAGFVETLARAGRNVTGVTQDTGNEMFGKRLELLKEIIPRGSREWAVLWNPTFRPNQRRWKATTGAAPKLGLTLLSAEMQGLDDLEPAFASIMKRHPGGLVVMSDAVLFTYRRQIASMALGLTSPPSLLQRADKILE